MVIKTQNSFAIQTSTVLTSGYRPVSLLLLLLLLLPPPSQRPRLTLLLLQVPHLEVRPNHRKAGRFEARRRWALLNQSGNYLPTVDMLLYVSIL